MKLENLPRINELARLLESLDQELKALLAARAPLSFKITFNYRTGDDIEVSMGDKGLTDFIYQAVVNHLQNRRERVVQEIEEL